MKTTMKYTKNLDPKQTIKKESQILEITGLVQNVTKLQEKELLESYTNREVIVARVEKTDAQNWHEIDWKKMLEKIRNLQEKIVIATLAKNYKEVYRIQLKVVTSFAGRALAVRKVVTNSGGKTAGVDKVIWKGPEEYYKAIMMLGKIVSKPNEYVSKPLRRVMVPKGNTGETRPLGIPTVLDRAVQALYHLGIDPSVEAVSDKNSFGFRKNRSTHDAIIAVRSHMDKKTHPHWILEADISKCFDKISHKFLMENTLICHKHVLEQWLKSGVMENLNYMETTEGTPQGGIISPVLCNVALNGIEPMILKAFPLKKGISPGVHLLRYADDMIVTGKNVEILEQAKRLINDYLEERGLELNEKKTKITHIKKGIDFLGFNIRRLPYNPKLNNLTEQETVLIIKPSKKGIEKLTDKIKKIIDKSRPIEAIIRDLNPILRGWGEHKRISYHSQEVFITLDHLIYQRMLKWTTRHKGSRARAIRKYWITTQTRKWNWGTSLTNKILNLAEIPIISPRPLKLDKNPYLEIHKEYFEKRKENQILAKFRAAIYKKYQNLCPICGDSLHNGERIELHHIVERKNNGKYKMDNIQPLHQICHQKVSHMKTEDVMMNESKT